MHTEKIGFKTRLFGGFDRSDVAASIERISTERNTYKKRVEELQAQVDALTDELASVREDATRAIQAATEASDRAKNAYMDAVEQAKATLRQLNTQYGNASTDLSAAIKATQSQIEMVRNQLDALWSTVDATGHILRQLATSSELDPSSFAGGQNTWDLETDAAHDYTFMQPSASVFDDGSMDEAVKDALNDLGLDVQDLQGEFHIDSESPDASVS